MDTDSFVFRFSGGEATSEHFDLGNLDIPFKLIEKSLLKLNTYSFVKF